MSDENVEKLIKLGQKLRIADEYDKVAKGRLERIRYEDGFFEVGQMAKQLELNSEDAYELSFLFKEFELNMSVITGRAKKRVVERIKELK